MSSARHADKVVIATAGGTRLHLAAEPDLTTDLLGIPPGGLVRRPAVVTDLVFRLRLVAPDCPFGPLDLEVLVDGDGRVTSDSWEPDLPETDHDPMAITAPYPMLLGFLHDRLIFGHLLWARAEVVGDLIDYAALSGIVNAPPGPRPEARLVDALFAAASGAD